MGVWPFSHTNHSLKQGTKVEGWADNSGDVNGWSKVGNGTSNIIYEWQRTNVVWLTFKISYHLHQLHYPVHISTWSFLTLCCRAMYKNGIAIPCNVDGSHPSTFSYTDVLHMCLSAGLTHLLLQGYQQLDARCLGLKLETNRPVLTPPLLEP
jgi:hypothetical protein